MKWEYGENNSLIVCLYPKKGKICKFCAKSAQQKFAHFKV